MHLLYQQIQTKLLHTTELYRRCSPFCVLFSFPSD